ncbi:MAG TPA: hypothetical protein ENK91_16515 [Bacteroidetes bacterium]|nr:hypothetical protein [Bacteroidota bacterium]
MKVKNDLTQKYSKPTIIIHWVSAILILILFPLGKYVEDLQPIDKLTPLKIHAILGIVVLILTLLRTYYFFKNPRPDHIKTGSKFNDKLAVWIHYSFYYLLFIITISGILAMIIIGYGNAIKANDISLIKPHENSLLIKTHGLMATIMMILFVLHVIGVVKHLIMTKENTLKRITFMK